MCCSGCRADLVPVYHLGVSQLLTFWGSERLSRRLRVTIGVFWCAPICCTCMRSQDPIIPCVACSDRHGGTRFPHQACALQLMLMVQAESAVWWQGQVGPAAAAEARHHQSDWEAHPRCAARRFAAPCMCTKPTCDKAAATARQCTCWGVFGNDLNPNPTVRAVAQCDKPSAEEVDRLHARFTHDIAALFDAHKHLLPGWEAKRLHVV